MSPSVRGEPVIGHDSERGFTVVEVVIAAMIAAGILSGLALAVGAAGKLQGVSKVKARMANVAESVLEEVQNNRTWMDNCERRLNSVQNLAGRIDATTLQDAESQTTYALVLQATARDFDVDGVGAKDMDGSTCDGFDMLVRISLPAADKPRLGAMPPVEIRTSIDTSGTIAKGALIVEACTAMNQVDDRLAIGGCAAGPGVSEARGNFTLMPGCQNAANCEEYDAIKHRPGHRRNESPHVATERIDVNISVRGPFGALPAPTRLAKGLWLYTNVPAGEYAITAPTTTTTPSSMGTPRRLQRWYTQEAPARGRAGVETKVAVEFGARSSALIAYKPRPPAASNVSILLRRTVTYLQWMPENHIVDHGWAAAWDANCFVSPPGSTTYICENRKNMARFEYMVPELVRTVEAEGTRNSVQFQLTPIPFNRAVEETAPDTFTTVNSTTPGTIAQGNQAGIDGRPPLGGQDRITLGGGFEAGLGSSLRASDAGTGEAAAGELVPISAGSASLLNRTWVDPVTGYLNGRTHHTLMFRDAAGECYVSMWGANIQQSNKTVYVEGTVIQETSGWTLAFNDVAYNEREVDGCTAPGAGCGSVYWQPTGDILLRACTLLLRSCDVTEYYYASNVPELTTSQTYWQHATNGVKVYGTTSPSPTDPMWTGPHEEVTGHGPDAAYAAANATRGYWVDLCDGYSPPQSCDAAGENCGVFVYIPPAHPNAKGVYAPDTIGASLTA